MKFTSVTDNIPPKGRENLFMCNEPSFSCFSIRHFRSIMRNKNDFPFCIIPTYSYLCRR